MPIKRASLMSAVIVHWLTAVAGQAAEPIANAGTLTCTVAPSQQIPTAAQTEANVSCIFSSISGIDAELSGRIVRWAATSERKSVIVRAWSVVSPTPDIAPNELSGRYSGMMPDGKPDQSSSSHKPGTLYGAASSGIELRPLNAPDPVAVPDAGLTILELEISSVKV